ncbi:hypothetical protein [Nocardioides sp. W7]|uniref:hypothetical protein n=1 Tax=Nocardioides sp. W7 TaxID=2931390 RepID=UPI001FCF9DCB|nr:hypothetical protein [Nocardioides sp. W7]
MKTLVALAALLLTLNACGSDGEDAATDPGPAGDSPAMPTDPPVPSGQVRSAHLATVMDTGTPELCLGPVAESYPPQCGGPAITNWDWAQHGHDMFDEQGDIRWGTFAVTGTWDGTAFEVSETVPGPLYDAPAVEPSTMPTPAASYSEAELEAVATEVRDLPGAQGSYSNGTTVTAEVMYDDGSLQAWADEEYGAGVVLVSSLLVDA